jgi:hypothetical protein
MRPLPDDWFPAPWEWNPIEPWWRAYWPMVDATMLGFCLGLLSGVLTGVGR